MAMRLPFCFCGFLFSLSCLPVADAQQQPTSPVTIQSQPRVIDSATLVPSQLSAVASRDFSDSSLRELIQWLQEEHGLVVLLDTNGLAEIGVSPAEPISDRLDGDPLYLLLNRLRSLGLTWYFRDEVLHVTSLERAETQQNTVPHHVGDLLDAGYERETLMSVIATTIAPDSWESVGGPGVLSALGDVLLIRQTGQIQRRIQGLMAALRSHGRQTFVDAPSQHVALWDSLTTKITVDFQDTPLEEATRQIGRIANIDIRLDLAALRQFRVREREPVTLRLADRELQTALSALLLDLDLTWILRDGVLWITSADESEVSLVTCVYDVRDLCRDDAESDSLVSAITSQTDPNSWDRVGGPGAIEAAKPGTLVINHQERIHHLVLELLETYRAALRSSKRRDGAADDPDKLLTVYYRMHADVAKDLVVKLPLLVHPASWLSEAQPAGKGTILRVNSSPDSSAMAAAKAGRNPFQDVQFAQRSVLVIRQTRAVHQEIASVLARIEAGDSANGGGFGGLGGSMGGGGFGGGFFAVPSSARPLR